MQKLILTLGFLLCLLLSACDPVASKTAIIRLKDDKDALKVVSRELHPSLVQAGFKRKSNGPDGDALLPWWYEGEIVEDDRHTNVSIHLSYLAPDHAINITIHQYIGFTLTPQMVGRLKEIKGRLIQTGYVTEIKIR